MKNFLKKKTVIIALVVVVAAAVILGACSKKCYDCGKFTSKGYTIFGNYYCEDCAGW